MPHWKTMMIFTIQRQVKSLYCAANKLRGTFDQCSPAVKNMLFCAYCMPMYCMLINYGANTKCLRAMYNAYWIMHYISRNVTVRPHQVSHCVRTLDAWLRNNLWRFLYDAHLHPTLGNISLFIMVLNTWNYTNFNGVTRTLSYTQAWVSGGWQEFEIFRKMAVFLVSNGKKTNYTTFGHLQNNFWKNLLVPPPGKHPFDIYALPNYTIFPPPRCWWQQIGWSYCVTSRTFGLVAWCNSNKKVSLSCNWHAVRSVVVMLHVSCGIAFRFDSHLGHFPFLFSKLSSVRLAARLALRLWVSIGV